MCIYTVLCRIRLEVNALYMYMYLSLKHLSCHACGSVSSRRTKLVCLLRLCDTTQAVGSCALKVGSCV